MRVIFSARTRIVTFALAVPDLCQPCISESDARARYVSFIACLIKSVYVWILCLATIHDCTIFRNGSHSIGRILYPSYDTTRIASQAGPWLHATESMIIINVITNRPRRYRVSQIIRNCMYSKFPLFARSSSPPFRFPTLP